MRIISRHKRIRVLKTLTAIRYIATQLMAENDIKKRIEYSEKIIENVCSIAFDVCTKKDAIVGMELLLEQIQKEYER